MSFTLTSQSVIRFESSTTRLGDEWQRTLMFFNVDISGGVHRDHRNEITAPRTQDRNGKRRNPGGGLSNSIRECAMPFGKPNEFYAQSRDDFDHRGSRPGRCSLGGRSKNSLYCESRRHMQYQSTKPRWSHADESPFSHCSTKSSTHRYVTPDYESANGYDDGYQNEEYQLPYKISRDLTYPEEARDSRNCYDTEFYTDSSYESPPDYYINERPKWGSYHRSYETPAYRNGNPYYPDELSGNDFNTNGWESLSQLNVFRPRGKQRQESGSMLPVYPLNYNDKYRHKESDGSYDRYKDSDYEDRFEGSQPPPEYGRKVRYSPLKRIVYDDYRQRRIRTPPIPSAKPKAKIRNECRTPYRAYREKGFPINQSRNYKAETDRSQSHEPGSRHGIRSREPERRHRSRSKESGSFRRNRSRRYSHLEKVPPYGAPFKKAREASAQYNRISKQILSLGSPKMYENNPKTHGTVPRKVPEKKKRNFIVEEIPQPYKKYIKNDVPLSNFLLDINDEIPRRPRNLVTEPSFTFGNTSWSKMYDKHDRKSNLKPSPNKNKFFDFGSEIPYRTWKNVAPLPMLIAFDVPLKRKDRTNYYKSDSDHDSGAVPYASSAARLKKEPVKKSNGPQVSLYDITNLQQPKSIKQKISGFLKMTKKCHRQSNIFKDKKKTIKNQRHDDKDNGKRRSSSNMLKSRTRSASPRSKITSTPGQKKSNLTTPSLSNTSKRCLSRIGTGSHYPTVFRGKCRNADNEEYSKCNIFCSTRCSKSDHCDRISSGNCSLNNDVKKNEPSDQSEGSLTGSLKIVASKTISHGSNNECSDSGSESICTSISTQAGVEENEFSSVRIPPTPSISQSPSSSSSCSQNSTTQGITYSTPTKINRQGIETCAKPPIVSKSTSSELGCNCPRRRICPYWSLTQKSCCRHQWNRPSRLGLCLPSNIEMSSRPPVVIPFNANKKSSLKGPNNRLESTSTKRVCLQISTSNSSQSKSSSGKSTANSDETSSRSGRGITISDKFLCSSEEDIQIPCCKAERKIDKPKCQKSQYNIRNSGEERKIESKPRASCSSGKTIKANDQSSGKSINAKRDIDNMEKPNCKNTQCNIEILCEEQKINDKSPAISRKSSKTCVIGSTCVAKEEDDNLQKSKSQCIMNNLGEKQKSDLTLKCSCSKENPSSTPSCEPQFPSKCPCSRISVCSRNLTQIISKCSAQNMQLACLPNGTCSPCLPNPNSEITKSLSPLPCDDSPEPIPKGDIATNRWTDESKRGKSIVEELKRELLNTFRKERNVHTQRPCFRNAPHIMIIPCQVPSIISSNQFYGPDPVVCWAACSKSQSPF